MITADQRPIPYDGSSCPTGAVCPQTLQVINRLDTFYST